MVYNISWDESQPDGSEAANTLDTELQELKESIRERLNDVLSNAWETDGSDPKLLDGSAFAAGGVTYAARASERARVSLGVSQAITTATVTAISWDTEDVDEGGLVDLGSNATRITIVNTGFYLLTASVKWAIDATGYRSLAFRPNGSGILARDLSTAGIAAQTFYQHVSWMGELTAADYIELIVAQASGSDLDALADADATYMAITRIA